MFLSDFRNITQLLNLKPKLMICSPKNIVKKKKDPENWSRQSYSITMIPAGTGKTEEMWNN